MTFCSKFTTTVTGWWDIFGDSWGLMSMEKQQSADRLQWGVSTQSRSFHPVCKTTISLLNMERKVLFRILAKRLTSSWQTSMLTPLYPVPLVMQNTRGSQLHWPRSSRTQKEPGDLAVMWVDSTNTYGTAPHNLVNYTLKAYHIPQKVQQITTTRHFKNGLHLWQIYYKLTGTWNRDWVYRLVIPFAATMNLQLNQWRSPDGELSSGVQHVSVRAFRC